MAVDTINKRSSVLGILPQPDADLTRYDRRQVLGYYSGIIFLKRSRYHRFAIVGFNKAWHLMSEPYLGLIGPISGWTLPANTTYDPHHDEFLDDGDDSVVEVDWEDQTQTQVAFLPMQGDAVVDLDIPGVLQTDMTHLQILWTSSMETAINTAWGIVVDGRLYVIKRWVRRPIGIEQPYMIDLYLSEGD